LKTTLEGDFLTTYLVELSQTASKELDKLDKETRKSIHKKIFTKLGENPYNAEYEGDGIWELKGQNFRAYYTIKEGVVFVDLVEFKGKVMVHKIGTKNSQDRDLSRLKR
jgi:mRNA-degrading endonuclease RelE of RelBE toxin-antitoxin system